MAMLLVTGFALYYVFTLTLRYYWRRNRPLPPRQNGPLLTVLIPVRNEAAHIEALLRDLDRQRYGSYEVVVVDDASDDGTPECVERLAALLPYELRLIRLEPDPTAVAHKKRAITAGVATARGEVIVATDGDCRVGPDWLSLHAAAHAAEAAVFASGPVTFERAATLREQVLTVEFASLVGAGGATLRAGMPTMANGANLSYRRETFEAVGGYDRADHIASGDDEFLMHKVAESFPGQVAFLRHPGAVVSTAAPQDWPAFVRQRRRWASKWPNYRRSGIKWLAVGVFTFHALLLIGVALTLAGQVPWYLFLALLGGKAVVEALYLGRVLRDMGHRLYRWAFLLLQVTYSAYVVFFGLLGASGRSYEWKGRRVR